MEKATAMKSIDESKYRGEYLALHPETQEVLAHDSKLHTVLEQAQQLGYSDPIIQAVPEEDIHFVEVR